MNLARMTLTLYLRNPAQRTEDNWPLIVLENGRRIIICELEHGFGDGVPGGVVGYSYQLYRELSRGNRLPLQHCYDLDDVAKQLATEAAAPAATLPRSYHFGSRR